jgi:predicted dinucleotide-binding enzyme
VDVGIIGSGRIGGTVGSLWARAGHRVLFSSRDPRRLEGLAARAGNGARAGTVEEAARSGEVVLLAVPWWEIDGALKAAGEGSLDDKVVIDATNPYSPGWFPASLPYGTTSLQINSQRMPRARVVKAFNTLTAGFQAETAGQTGPDRVVMFYAGDDAGAKEVVAGLIEDAGFEPVDVGDSKDVAWMEPPRRAGALYGEEFHPAEARGFVATRVRQGDG